MGSALRANSRAWSERGWPVQTRSPSPSPGFSLPLPRLLDPGRPGKAASNALHAFETSENILPFKVDRADVGEAVEAERPDVLASRYWELPTPVE